MRFVLPRVPFKKGDKVSVIRTRHGWHDGKLTAIVTDVYQKTSGRTSYHVKDSEGMLYEVLHTRDMHKHNG